MFRILVQRVRDAEPIPKASKRSFLQQTRRRFVTVPGLHYYATVCVSWQR